MPNTLGFQSFGSKMKHRMLLIILALKHMVYLLKTKTKFKKLMIELVGAFEVWVRNYEAMTYLFFVVFVH